MSLSQDGVWKTFEGVIPSVVSEESPAGSWGDVTKKARKVIRKANDLQQERIEERKKLKADKLALRKEKEAQKAKTVELFREATDAAEELKHQIAKLEIKMIEESIEEKVIIQARAEALQAMIEEIDVVFMTCMLAAIDV